MKDECHFKEHPDFNKTAGKWEDSDVGKAQKQAGPNYIQWGKKLQGGLVDEILDSEEDTFLEKDPDQLMSLITKSTKQNSDQNSDLI